MDALARPKRPKCLGWVGRVNDRWFEWLILFNIVLSSLLLAIQDPSLLRQPSWIIVSDVFFASVFLIEMLLKLLHDGFIMPPTAYPSPYRTITI